MDRLPWSIAGRQYRNCLMTSGWQIHLVRIITIGKGTDDLIGGMKPKIPEFQIHCPPNYHQDGNDSLLLQLGSGKSAGDCDGMASARFSFRSFE
jgi:hypothetical protein